MIYEAAKNALMTKQNQTHTIYFINHMRILRSKEVFHLYSVIIFIHTKHLQDTSSFLHELTYDTIT